MISLPGESVRLDIVKILWSRSSGTLDARKKARVEPDRMSRFGSDRCRAPSLPLSVQWCAQKVQNLSRNNVCSAANCSCLCESNEAWHIAENNVQQFS